VLVNKDGRPAGSKSYMWVYRTGRMYAERQIVLYEYQRTRNAIHLREFLKDFSGVCVTDGYQVYHTIENEREDLGIAGCWSHARRRFDEAVKALPKAMRDTCLAHLALTMIQAIYREERVLKELSPEDPPPAGREAPGGGLLRVGERKHFQGPAKEQDMGRFQLFAQPGKIPESVPG
jgi:hypothetical protein